MFATAQIPPMTHQTVAMASHGSDAGLYVEFRTEAVHQPFESEKEGRPIFKDTPFIKILFPGDKTKTVDRPATDEDKARFAPQWAAFERSEDQAVASGLPITEWPPITKSQAAELKGLGIHTVEALAGMADTACTWLGARQMRDRARVWLDSADGHAKESALQAENDQLRARLAALEAQMADVVARTSAAPARGAKGARAQETTE